MRHNHPRADRRAPVKVRFAGPVTARASSVRFDPLEILDGLATPDPVELLAAVYPLNGATEELAADFGTGSVDVAAVPEPPSLVLFVTALGLWLFFGRWTDRRHFE